jgi:hypothetical protein
LDPRIYLNRLPLQLEHPLHAACVSRPSTPSRPRSRPSRRPLKASTTAPPRVTAPSTTRPTSSPSSTMPRASPAPTGASPVRDCTP